MGKFCTFLLQNTREKFMKILRKSIIIFLLSVWAGKGSKSDEIKKILEKNQ
jgi:hypothetical protein